MPIKTKRWCDPIDPDDGYRLLVCRYRPRALPKARETWDEWIKELGPSKELHAEIYGKAGPPIGWDEFQRKYIEEMRAQAQRIDELANQVGEGRPITLLCSSACADEAACHRSLLRGLIEERMREKAGKGLQKRRSNALS